MYSYQKTLLKKIKQVKKGEKIIILTARRSGKNFFKEELEKILKQRKEKKYEP